MNKKDFNYTVKREKELTELFNEHNQKYLEILEFLAKKDGNSTTEKVG
jgi:hypothetical protein